MSGSRHDWLDDETAERLLRGEPIVAENAGTGEFGGDAAYPEHSRRLHALSTLMSSVSGAVGDPVEPEREEAALAAFRNAHADAGTEAASAAHDVVTDVITVSAGCRVVVNGRRRIGRLRGWSGSAKVAVAAAVTATALASGFTAAAVGVIPSPFTGGGLDPASHAPGVHRPSIDASELPQTPEPAGSASSAPAASGAAGGRSAQGAGPSSGGLPGADHDHGDHGPAKGISGDHDVDALCQAYFASEGGHGSAVRHDSLNWLVAMAGGQKSVNTYCSHELGRPAPRDSSSVVRSPSVPATGTGTGSAGAGNGTGSFGPGSGSPSGSGGCSPRSHDGAFAHVSGVTTSAGSADGASGAHSPGSNGSGANGSGGHGSSGHGPSGGHGSCGAGSGGAGSGGAGSGGSGRHAGGAAGSLAHLPRVPYVAAVAGHPIHLRPLTRPVAHNAAEKL
jgi:hypothetical protein